MSDIPRLAWPLQLVNGSLATIEQDSDEDIQQCVAAILRHRPNSRSDVPEMGVPDHTHGEQPLDVESAAEVVERHEPRVSATATSTTDAIEQAIANVDVRWSRIEQET